MIESDVVSSANNLETKLQHVSANMAGAELLPTWTTWVTWRLANMAGAELLPTWRLAQCQKRLNARSVGAELKLSADGAGAEKKRSFLKIVSG